MGTDLSLTGLHHVSALTGQAQANQDFYTQVLGLRLVCKTVNQDDTSSYHLFYGDETGAPGTEVTFFDLPRARALREGTGLITGTSLRVRGIDTLRWWTDRFAAHDVLHTTVYERAGRPVVTFYDPEGQRLHLVDDSEDVDRVPDTTPWPESPVPEEHAIRGLGPTEITIGELDPTRIVLVDLMGFREARAYTATAHDDPMADDVHRLSTQPPDEAFVFETGPGGVASELHVVVRPDAPRGWLGRGGVHHVALRTPDEGTIRAWRKRIDAAGLDISPVIDRHYFHSIYVREPGGILIEIATDTGAPFPVDEADAGTVTLPPKLEPQRDEIEATLTPLGPPRPSPATP